MTPAGKATRGRDRRTAYAPLKHDSERITERWARTGRRDKSAPDETPATMALHTRHTLAEVTESATRAALYKIAKRLAVKGRSAMTKRQLLEAIRGAVSHQPVAKVPAVKRGR